MTHLFSEPQPIITWDEEDPPRGFTWNNASHEILEIVNTWRVHTRWWEPFQIVWREYFKIVTDTGHLCQIYHDLQNGGWYLARIYD